MKESDSAKHSLRKKESSAYGSEVTHKLSTVRLAVGGMTCVACVRAIIDAVSELEGVSDISVNQVGKSASAVVTGADLVESIVTTIEDIGYECDVIAVTPILAVGTSGRADKRRNVALEFQDTPPKKIESILEEFKSNVTILQPYTRDPPNVLRINYTPSAPHFTIRTIISTISTATTSAVSIWHPPSADEVARKMYRREQRKLLFRLMVAVLAAFPIFIIGIVYMSLLEANNPGRLYFERSVWVGQVTRGEWALFIISTPVMFYAAEDFHRRSLQELWFLWKPGSRESWTARFLRFGSMNLLISLGISVAYFSSIVELAISASRDSNATAVAAGSSTYFDSVAFLTMFLLIGRFIEAFSKQQAADAITLLGKLRGFDALLLIPEPTSSSTTQDTSNSEDTQGHHPSGTKINKISADLLELGDIVRVPPGATPPADGTIVSLDATNFDESSLTGESRNVMKTTGDQIFVGTINKLRMVDMRVDAIEGNTMLEQVIEAVLHGQTKRAPIERIVNVVTAYFVPVITALAILTWIIWLSLGLSGVLPANTLTSTVGRWPAWSLEFAISVFVVACPCGIGLAAPTALLVGSGLAAKYGILARGGGEAFQEASQIDVFVFDKTGTLTEGSEPKVTDIIIHGSQSTSKDENNHQFNEDEAKWRSAIAAIVLQLAATSSHPLCLSLRQYYQGVGGALPAVVGIDIEELPGCGMKGLFRFQSGDDNIIEVRALLGNETWLREQGATSDQNSEQLHRMKSQGKSIVLLALDNTKLLFSPRGNFSIVAVFAISDHIRPEAPSVISQLHAQDIEIWMISGDNEITAQAVARSVGIPLENVIAGVLPQHKAEKIRWLQSFPRRDVKRNYHGQKGRRKIVAMVGDGINDAPALTAADVGIAMGSGSDIALSSAEFVLLSSNLHTLLILTDLSKTVFRRIKFNFVWATIYNLIALPIAAGVIYPAGHTRLSPVWSSVAMALSSTSVVGSSLLLRLYKEPRFKNPSSISEIATDERKHAVEV